MRHLPLLCLTLAAAAPVLAQSRPELLALTRLTPLLVRVAGDCALRSCCPSLPTPMPPIVPQAGGSAYDGVRGAAWISDGFRILLVDAAGCTAVCGPFAPPVTGTLITGLAHDPAADRLWFTTLSNVLGRMKAGCPPTLESTCTPQLPVGYTLTGVACDAARDLLLVGAAAFNAPAPLPNLVLVGKLSSPCITACTLQVNACGAAQLGPLTGLAWDPCNAVLWVTDGRSVVAGNVDPGRCSFVATSCCPNVLPANDALVDLALLPSLPAGSGTSCLSPVCGTCPAAMVHSTIGVPLLGNASFALALDNAPVGNLGRPVDAFLVLGEGACAAGGVLVPPFCGPLLVPLAPLFPIVLGPFQPRGTSACSGTVRVPLPVPLDLALCGHVLASQFVLTCSVGPAFGGSVSDCASWLVGGS